MIVSVHQPQYLPWLGYFDKIDRSNCFVFLDNVQYKVREFQNRNKIRTNDGSIWLTVPVESKGKGRQNIRDISIDNGLDWPKDHWQSIQSCYKKSLFFDDHADFFESVFSTQWDKLIDLNIHIIEYLLKSLKIETPIQYESTLDITTQKTDRIIDICTKLKADAYLSGIGGRDYLEEDKFEKAGIKLIYQEFTHPKYQQRFMKDDDDFLPFMSTIDLLFNKGEESINVLRGQ